MFVSNPNNLYSNGLTYWKPNSCGDQVDVGLLSMIMTYIDDFFIF